MLKPLLTFASSLAYDSHNVKSGSVVSASLTTLHGSKAPGHTRCPPFTIASSGRSDAVLSNERGTLMTGNPQTYFFGRFHLMAANSDKRQLLQEGLTARILLEIRNFMWGFFVIKEFTADTGQYFTGYLAKYKRLTQEEVADEEQHAIILEDAERRIVAKSRFFLHVESGLIVYHPAGRNIRAHQFRSNFCRLFEKAHENFFVAAEIQSIDRDVNILDKIARFSRISKVSFHLHPSNPNPGIWKDVDDRLKRLAASEYKEEYISHEEKGLNRVTQDKDFTDKLNMAVDGYGEAEVIGRLDGRDEKISTGDNPVSANVEHDDLDFANVFEDLRSAIEDIFKRFM